MPKPKGKQKIMAKYTNLVSQRLYGKEVLVFFADFCSLRKEGNMKEVMAKEKKLWRKEREIHKKFGDVKKVDEIHQRFIDTMEYGYSADFVLTRGLNQPIALVSSDHDIQRKDLEKTKIKKNTITYNSLWFQERKLDDGAWNTIVHEVTHEKISAIQNRENEHPTEFEKELERNKEKVRDLKEQFEKELQGI